MAEQDRSKVLASKLFAPKAESKNEAPKVKGTILFNDKDGMLHLCIPQRITMDMLRYKINDKGQDSFGICVDFGALEFVADGGMDANGKELEKVMKSSPVYVNINGLR